MSDGEADAQRGDELLAAGDRQRDGGELNAAVRSYEQAGDAYRAALEAGRAAASERRKLLREKPAPPPVPRGPWASKKAGYAVRAALEWLARHQDDDGRWDCDAFTKHDAAGKRTGGGRALYDVGVTGLALLCFLESGYADGGEGDAAYYAVNVGEGLRWLILSQDDQGVFGARADMHFIYNHAAATLAMVRAYAATRKPAYSASAQAGVDFLLAARNPGLGWRYEPRGEDNDTSVTAWCARALHAAGEAGLKTDPAALEGALAWVEKMTDPEFGQVGYNLPGGAPGRPQSMMDRFPPEKSQSMTAAGILVRLLAGGRINANLAIRRGIELILETPPLWSEEAGTIDMVYWHYASLALKRVGGRSWMRWKTPMRAVCLAAQRGGGPAVAGSWDPAGAWGEEGGRVYATATMTLTPLATARGR